MGLSWVVLLLVSLGVSHAFAARWWPGLDVKDGALTGLVDDAIS